MGRTPLPAAAPEPRRPEGPSYPRETHEKSALGPRPDPAGPVVVLAVRRAKIKIKNPRIRVGIGPKPAISLKHDSPDPPPGPPRGGGGGPRKKIKIILSTSRYITCKVLKPEINHRDVKVGPWTPAGPGRTGGGVYITIFYENKCHLKKSGKGPGKVRERSGKGGKARERPGKGPGNIFVHKILYM